MNREELKGRAYQVLDKGFVQLIDFMGTDEDICSAARVSYGKGTKSISDNKNLLRYLMRHRHTTPYEMVELKFRIMMPMDAWRQFIRHRTASVNEYSTRYSEAIDEMACTDPAEWRLQSTTNKQGSGTFITEWTKSPCSNPSFINGACNQQGAYNRYGAKSAGEYLSCREKELHKYAKAVYQERLEFGMAREQARKDLPLSNYTMAYWKIDLHNLFHFLKLRCDSHAQFEIRQYANILAGFVKELYPLAFEAWYDYSYQAVNFTRLDRMFLNYLHCSYGAINQFDEVLEGCKNRQTDIDYATQLGMSKRELDEFWKKLAIPEYQDFTLPQDKLLEIEDGK